MHHFVSLSLLEKYSIPANEFYEKLDDEEYEDRAKYEFLLCKQLNVTGFPAVFIQLSETKFYQVVQGYTDFESVKSRIDKVLAGDPADS